MGLHVARRCLVLASAISAQYTDGMARSGSVRVTSSDGETASLTVEPGDTRYNEAGTVERIDIVSGAPRAMVFEFK